MAREVQTEDFRLAVICIWKSKVLIIFAALAGLFAGLLFTADSANQQIYQARSSVYCSVNSSSLTNSLTLNNVMNYSDVVTSRKVCEYAASLIKETALTAEDIQNMIYVRLNSNSYVMSIIATNSNPAVAIKVTNAVAQAFTSEMVNITNGASVQILDVATNSSIAYNGSVNKTRMLFVVIAVVLSAGAVALRSLFSDKVRSISQCAEDEEEILGIVPFMN